MGCWNETCMLSHLPIMMDDAIKVIILIKRNNEPRSENVYFDDGYTPLTFPFDATYNDYGGIEDFDLSAYTLAQIASAKLFTKEDTPYEFTSVEQLIDDINQTDVYIKTAMGMRKLECVYIHKKLYDTLIEKISTRKPYNQSKSISELLMEKYNGVKDKWLAVIESGKPFDKENWITMRLVESVFENANAYSFIQNLIVCNLIKADDIDKFIKEAHDYRLFTYTLSEGRIGYITRCGTGDQCRSIFTQKIIAEFILNESKRQTEDDDPVYDDEDTLFWY